jgi:hypothetical protein
MTLLMHNFIGDDDRIHFDMAQAIHLTKNISDRVKMSVTGTYTVRGLRMYGYVDFQKMGFLDYTTSENDKQRINNEAEKNIIWIRQNYPDMDTQMVPDGRPGCIEIMIPFLPTKKAAKLRSKILVDPIRGMKIKLKNLTVKMMKLGEGADTPLDDELKLMEQLIDRIDKRIEDAV